MSGVLACNSQLLVNADASGIIFQRCDWEALPCSYPQKKPNTLVVNVEGSNKRNLLIREGTTKKVSSDY